MVNPHGRTDVQVFLYNKLVDMFPKHQLFYLIGGFYFVVFSSIAIALADPVIGVANDASSPTRLIGEENYCINMWYLLKIRA